MLTSHHNSIQTRLEDDPLVKRLATSCPVPSSSQGGYPLTHYGETQAPGLHVMVLAMLLIAQYLLLALLFVPITRVPAIFTAWLMMGGLLGAWCCHFGKGLRRRTTTKAKNATAAERSALWTRFPSAVRACNLFGILLLFGLAAYEVTLWLHGTSRANLRSVIVAPAAVIGVVVSWIGIAFVHKFFSGAALWVMATSFLRMWDIRRNRKNDPLSDARLYVHGWRRTKLSTIVELSFAYAHSHYVVPQKREGGQYVSVLFSFGNFTGNHAAELCQDQLENDQKASLARALELVMLDQIAQPPVGAEAAVPEAEVLEAVKAYAATSAANAAAIARASAGKPIIGSPQDFQPPRREAA